MDPADAILPPAGAASIPLWLSPSIQVLYGITAVTRSKPLAFFAVIYGLYWVVEFFRHPPPGDYLSVYLPGTMLFGNVGRVINANFIQKAEDFERKTDAKKDDDGKKSRRGIKQTVLDILEVAFVATRGVGWNWQLRTIQPSRVPAGHPRWKFVLKSLSGAAIRLLAVDAANLYIRSTPLGTLPVTKSFADEPLHIAMGRAWLIYLMGRWSMDAYYRIAASVLTGVGIYNPQDWPPFFGSWKEAYTVRRFWSHTWHQMMRPIAQFPTNWAASSLHLPRNSKFTFYFKVSGAFFFAYALHAYGTHLAGGSHMVDIWRYAPQVFAMYLEEKIIEMAKARGVRDGWMVRILGYAWVVVFQGYTLMWWQVEAARLGAYTTPPFGFSVFEWAINRFG